MLTIGILTLPFNNNYGGYLQCFALMKVLRDMGHEPILINRRPRVKLYVKRYIKGVLLRFLCKDKMFVYDISSFERRYRFKGANMLKFVEKNICPQTRPIYNGHYRKLLKRHSISTIIVGSDQVWRPKYVPNVCEFFLEDVPSSVKKIAYSASFGTDELEYDNKQLEKCRKLLRDFKAVSVRENSGVHLLKESFEYSGAVRVLDPTMLLSKEEYMDIFSLTGSNNERIFSYILDNHEDTSKIVKAIQAKAKLPTYNFLNAKADEAYPSIEEWIRGIYSSELVITDSFHGTVYSIILNKPFYTIANVKRGNSRMVDLLSLFGLEDRLLSSESDAVEVHKPIDWCKVNGIINREATFSKNFLINSLS